MKKTIKTLYLFFAMLFFLSTSAFAQNFQGYATYQSSRKMDGFGVKLEGASPDMEAKLKEQLKKQFQKEYELKFNLTESVWKEVESLDGGPTSASSGGVVVRIAGNMSGVTYKNTAENLYLRESEVFNKPFLVNDELESREWQITNETKQIGNYTAYKAIYNDIRESRVISFSSNSNKPKDDKSEAEIKTDTVQVVAWYTPQIPVSQGPGDYWGLPGLILELTDGPTTYLCTKVVLNPEETVVIKKPSKGKKVTRAELQAEMDAKMEEMGTKFSNGKGEMKFKIGGN
ncbi:MULTISPECIES: GLPGLI family protein [Roseivirga]|nr:MULTISPECIES: GLPGLI family protein [Roseivirga]|tara:strand:- start:6770 stop:7630 length:861 start_codon:yes stop_codon:yes gene_type:complete